MKILTALFALIPAAFAAILMEGLTKDFPEIGVVILTFIFVFEFSFRSISSVKHSFKKVPK